MLVAGQAKLMPVRIADANAYTYWSTVAQGLTWAADNGARVANISYVGVASSSAVQSAAQYMKGKGGLVVVSAGNNVVIRRAHVDHFVCGYLRGLRRQRS